MVISDNNENDYKDRHALKFKSFPKRLPHKIKM